MGKISYRRRSKRRRSNSIQRENDQQGVIPDNVKQEREISEHSFSEPRQTENQSDGISPVTPQTPTSLSQNTSAVDGSHVSSPVFSHNNVGHVTIINNYVTENNASDTGERNRDPPDGFSDIDTSATTILRTPKKSKKFRRSRCSAARRSLSPLYGQRDIVGEITGALVTSEYHCSDCSVKIPTWKPLRFRVKCPGCRMSWKCAKIQCTCKAKITLELSRGRTQRVTLDDSLLRSIVKFKSQGYCETESIEKKILKVGSVRVEYNDRAVKSVTRISSSSVSP